MKAAVLNQLGTNPTYSDFPDPRVENEQQEVVTMIAASIKQLDLLKASGKHYTIYPSFPTVVGVDGVGVLANGKRIYAAGITGMMAEKALVTKNRWVELPDGIENELAAALPNALMGADAALLYRGKIKEDDTVLINGATGVTGALAVQLAKFRGAKKVIATGRNKTKLTELQKLGADEVISLEQEDNTFIKQLSEIYEETPVDIILDYLWGRPMQLILTALKNTKNLKHTKIVTVGEMAGASISLESGILRSKDIELIGSGIGSLSPEILSHYMQNQMPEMFRLAAEGKLIMDIETVNLVDVEEAWRKAARSSKRIVVKI